MEMVDNRMVVCRACLARNVEYHNLEMAFDEADGITLKDAFIVCTQLNDEPDFPSYLCTKCYEALQVSYNFMQNAFKAHKILLNQLNLHDDAQRTDDYLTATRSMRFRCKICGDTVESKKSLKEHVKLHLDIIFYCCQLCSFECKTRTQLSAHYANAHGRLPTREQLKPKADVSMECDRACYDIVNIKSQTDSKAIFNKCKFAQTRVNDMSPTSTVEEINSNMNGKWNEVDVDAPTVDYDDLIIEEQEGHIGDNVFKESLKTNGQKNAEPTSAKVIKCKICSKHCISQERLKLHMLTHNEIPHFFCDQCPFYTFFKVDLMQHYKTQHKLFPTHRQLQPKNKIKTINGNCKNDKKSTANAANTFLNETKCIYNCDMCLYETNTKNFLCRHYLSKHQIKASEIQLRPTTAEVTDVIITRPTPLTDNKSSNQKQQNNNVVVRNEETNRCLLKPDYPNGLQCTKCNRLFYWRAKLKEHYKRHNLNEKLSGTNSEILESNINIMKASSKHLTVQPTQLTKISNVSKSLNANTTDVRESIKAVGTMPTTSTNAPVIITPAESHTALLDATPPAESHKVPLAATPPAVSHKVPLDATPPPAAHTVPLDAIPQVVEMDIIENDYDFNGDVFFEDYDEETDATDDVDDQYDLILTSDEDNDYIDGDQLELSDNKIARIEAYCAQCNRRFSSQYQFENHMFVHRGLAPYRCEMCTNLYNTKRALIRHYRAVHKHLPTRDMIQAKGDKSKSMNQVTVVDQVYLMPQHVTTFLCAKCPFETKDLPCLQLHLRINHATNDENYILQKLPYECPRCIRSFGTRTRLQRHLMHSHATSSPIKRKPQQHAVTQATVLNHTTSLPIVSNATVAADLLPSIASVGSVAIATDRDELYKTNPQWYNSQNQKLKILFNNETE